MQNNVTIKMDCLILLNRRNDNTTMNDSKQEISATYTLTSVDFPSNHILQGQEITSSSSAVQLKEEEK